MITVSPYTGIGENVVFVYRIQTGESTRGNPVYSDVETTYTNVVFAPEVDTEGHKVERNQVLQTGVLHFLAEYPDVPLSSISDSRVIIRGVEWEVEGEGFDWSSPFTQEHFAWSLRVRRQNG